MNHKFSDMEKRAVSDNPFGYEPVSPYCIIFPTTQAGELQIVNLPGDLSASINEMKNAAESISNAAQQMGDNINTFAQQTATIILLVYKEIRQNMVIQNEHIYYGMLTIVRYTFKESYSE